MDDFSDFYEAGGSLFKTGIDAWTQYDKYTNSNAGAGPGAVYGATSGAAAAAPQQPAGALGGGTMMMIVVAVLVALLAFLLFRG